MLIASSIITSMAIFISTIAASTLQVHQHRSTPGPQVKVGHQETQESESEQFGPKNESRSLVQLIQPPHVPTVRQEARYHQNKYIGVNVQGEKVPRGGNDDDDDGDGDNDEEGEEEEGKSGNHSDDNQRNDDDDDDDVDGWISRVFCKRDARGGGSGRAGGGRAGGSKTGGIRSGAGGGISPAHRGYRPNSATTWSPLVSANSIIIAIALNVTLVLLVQGLNFVSQ